MIPPHEFVPIIAILATLIGLPAVVFWGILRIKRENRAALDSDRTMGLRELEEHIQEAVRDANEPLRRQVALLEARLDRIDESRQLPAGIGREGLLASPEKLP